MSGLDEVTFDIKSKKNFKSQFTDEITDKVKKFNECLKLLI